MEPRPDIGKPFLTVAEAAAESGFCETHLRRLIKRGECPGRRAGKAYSIPAALFRTWLAGDVTVAPAQKRGW